MSLTRIGLAVVALIAAVSGAYALFRALDERAAPPIVIEDAAFTQPVVVDVRGAVETPGVYELAAGARVQDALVAAGGLTQAADPSTINLARRLRDGEVVTISERQMFVSSPEPAGLAETGHETADGLTARININIATASELDILPGIGEVTAERIIDFREENGPYRSVDELIHVQGISARTIEGFQHLVTIAP